MIPLASFQSFDRGGRVVVSVFPEWDLRVGDTVEWECAQFGGLARVVARSPDKPECTVEKAS